jgi:TATA-box binding protein (TBP) (component of TFIID and TFIIIB)
MDIVAEIKKDFPTFNITVMTVILETDITDPADIIDIATINGKKPTKKFYNSYDMKLKFGDSKLTLKMFKNGKIHVTGCKSFDLIDKLIDYIKQKKPNSTISEPKICMINTHVKIADQICLEDLQNVINTEGIEEEKKEKSIHSAIYQPCRYQGLKASYNGLNTGSANGSAKILVFTSGYACIISKNIKDIQKALTDLNKLITNNTNV